jgi:long-chain acyl-CoA synthetase
LPQPLPRGRNPFDETGVERDAEGRARYVDRPASLVEMLRTSVERDASATAVLEVSAA